LQEDVDVIGLSILSGAHMALAPRILELLKKNGQDQVKVFIGGIIPDEDMPRLKEMGITGTADRAPTNDIIGDVRVVKVTQYIIHYTLFETYAVESTRSWKASPALARLFNSGGERSPEEPGCAAELFNTQARRIH
jgi:hypothetical protein